MTRTADTVERIYTERKERFEARAETMGARLHRIGLLRIFYFLGGAYGCYYAFQYYPAVAWYILGVFLVLFLLIVKWYDRLQAEKAHELALAEVNARELAALNHQFSHFDGLAGHTPVEHPYASDLDIFGEESVCQFVNRSVSPHGETALAKALSQASDRPLLLERQAAVDDLVERIDFRQTYQAIGARLSHQQLKEKIDRVHPDVAINKWLKAPPFISNSRFLTLLTFALPALMLIGLIGLFIGLIPYQVPLVLWLVKLSIIKLTQADTTKVVEGVGKYAKHLRTYEALLKEVEETPFEADLLKRLQAELIEDGQSASGHIAQLTSLAANLNIRTNAAAFLILNTFFLWELLFCYRLEHWKKTQQLSIARWFEALGQVECLYSFATIAFNHPDWCTPEILEENGEVKLSAQGLGHPLIDPKECISNEIAIIDDLKIMLITGSNMSGKSTFLRTVGINTVLAMAGSRVCANKMSLSVVLVHTSMRALDSLQESASAFYAELLGLKRTLDAVKRAQPPVFYLLDEILKGTNSQDRHQGSRALIEQLLRYPSRGIIATHDLDLCTLAERFSGQLENHCFEVQVTHGEMYFDYKIKPGVCRSMNATLLMRSIGIEV